MSFPSIKMPFWNFWPGFFKTTVFSRLCTTVHAQIAFYHMVSSIWKQLSTRDQCKYFLCLISQLQIFSQTKNLGRSFFQIFWTPKALFLGKYKHTLPAITKNKIRQQAFAEDTAFKKTLLAFPWPGGQSSDSLIQKSCPKLGKNVVLIYKSPSWKHWSFWGLDHRPELNGRGLKNPQNCLKTLFFKFSRRRATA